MPELKALVYKARHFSEEEKRLVLDKHIEILEEIIPTYKKLQDAGQIEIITSPYYHPILPLLYNTKIAKEANIRTPLPALQFTWPADAQTQVEEAVKFCQSRFGQAPQGMWPSEESVSEHILPLLINAGISWIVADEAILFKSLKFKKRDTKTLYQPHLLKRKDGDLNIIFRDRNLSDLIGFVYYQYKTEDAVNDFMKHLENIYLAFKEQDILVTIAMDGENAWEYYPGDGQAFLNSLYQKLSESKFIKTTTVNDYLRTHPPKAEIKRLACGSWIYANFSKWIGDPYKNKAWEYLAKAREELESSKLQAPSSKPELAYKQIYIAEGSDWFWWYGENHADFDELFRTHLANFYTIIQKDIPDYLKRPLTT
jgi:alpha-amylase/alpha-mannosidase (GH57 family)